MPAKPSEADRSLPPATSRAVSPVVARIVLLGLLLLLVAALNAPAPALKLLDTGQGDLALYEAEVDRLRNGEEYYSVIASELRRRGYATASVFNWRMPFPVLAVARAATPTRICFFALGVFAIAGTLALLIKAAPEPMLVAVLAQIGVTVSLLQIPEYILMAEAWSGLLMVSSVVMYGFRAWSTGAVLGVLALFARELAAPYCVVCGLVAVARRRRRESAVWIVGAVLYTTYALFHVAQVRARLGAHEFMPEESWVQFGGLPFLLRVIGFAGWYTLLPAWTKAAGCVLLVASAWAPAAPQQLRLAVMTYLVFFTIVGHPFNDYWGVMTAWIFALATGYGVTGLWRLMLAASGRHTYASP